MKTLWFCTVAVAAALSLSGSPTMGRNRLHTFNEENVLGTSFEFKVAAVSSCRRISRRGGRAARDRARTPYPQLLGRYQRV